MTDDWGTKEKKDRSYGGLDEISLFGTGAYQTGETRIDIAVEKTEPGHYETENVECVQKQSKSTKKKKKKQREEMEKVSKTGNNSVYKDKKYFDEMD